MAELLSNFLEVKKKRREREEFKSDMRLKTSGSTVKKQTKP